MKTNMNNAAFSLIELMVCMSILSILLGLLLTAVQQMRAAALRMKCANNVRQCTLACHMHHDTFQHLPTGHSGRSNRFGMAFLCQLLPYIEQETLFQQIQADFSKRIPFAVHPNLSKVISQFYCPTDYRASMPVRYQNLTVALSSYLGVNGTDFLNSNGVFFHESQVRFFDIIDGTSSTLLIGERPASRNHQFGWWYAGAGQRGTGSLDAHMGVRERNRGSRTVTVGGCPTGPYAFQQGSLRGRCDVFHFWSLHPGGAHFAFADGSVKFLRYSADAILPALATRAGGEVVAVPE